MKPADLIKEIIAASPTAPEWSRLATVTSVTGGLFVRFDGEASASTRSYARLNTYTPSVSHRVLMVRSGNTWVALGSIV